jgi:pyruvate dehydrogenase E2 component (dihydrolipoamide acetyltransferase)
MTDIVMPRLSDTMEEGTILRWLAADGQEIHRGDELVEIETDKATMVYESDQDGVLHTIASEGDSLAVGELIARVGEDGAGAEPAAGQATAATAHAPARAAPAAGDADGSAAPAAAPPSASPQQPGAERSGGTRVKASPLARRIARERGIDLRALAGTGPGGRIVKRDVQSAPQGAVAREASAQGTPATAAGPREAGAPPEADARQEAGAPHEAGAPPPEAAPGVEGVMTAKGTTSEVELTRTQQTIARRMAESKATIPHFAIEVDVDMEACVALRAQLGRHAGAVTPAAERDTPAGAPARPPADPTPTYNDMVVKASALALRAHPRANSSYRDGRLQLHERVNVGVAVATESEQPQGGALIVPTIFDADRKALGEISREARALAARVRDASITPPELSGGTFTVSNLGMFGVRSFEAIINPPQAAILSVGAVRAVPVVRDGEIVARHLMSLTLACDHRILYGADAARFLAHIRQLLEEPAALML